MSEKNIEDQVFGGQGQREIINIHSLKESVYYQIYDITHKSVLSDSATEKKMVTFLFLLSKNYSQIKSTLLSHVEELVEKYKKEADRLAEKSSITGRSHCLKNCSEEIVLCNYKAWKLTAEVSPESLVFYLHHKGNRLDCPVICDMDIIEISEKFKLSEYNLIVSLCACVDSIRLRGYPLLVMPSKASIVSSSSIIKKFSFSEIAEIILEEGLSHFTFTLVDGYSRQKMGPHSVSLHRDSIGLRDTPKLCLKKSSLSSGPSMSEPFINLSVGILGRTINISEMDPVFINETLKERNFLRFGEDDLPDNIYYYPNVKFHTYTSFTAMSSKDALSSTTTVGGEIGAEYGAFAFNASVSHKNVSQNSDEYKNETVSCNAICHFGTVRLDDFIKKADFIDREFKEYLLHAETDDDFDKIAKLYGTHYISGFEIGGVGCALFSLTSSQIDTMNEQSLSIQAQLKAFVVSSSATYTKETNETIQKMAEDISISLTLYGGGSQMPTIDPTSGQMDFLPWESSVKEDPVAIGVSVAPIHEMLIAKNFEGETEESMKAIQTKFLAAVKRTLKYDPSTPLKNRIYLQSSDENSASYAFSPYVSDGPDHKAGEKVNPWTVVPNAVDNPGQRKAGGFIFLKHSQVTDAMKNSSKTFVECVQDLVMQEISRPDLRTKGHPPFNINEPSELYVIAFAPDHWPYKSLITIFSHDDVAETEGKKGKVLAIYQRTVTDPNTSISANNFLFRIFSAFGAQKSGENDTTVQNFPVYVTTPVGSKYPSMTLRWETGWNGDTGDLKGRLIYLDKAKQVLRVSNDQWPGYLGG